MSSLRKSVPSCLAPFALISCTSTTSRMRFSSANGTNGQNNATKDDDLKIDFEKIEKSLNEQFGGRQPQDVDKNFMNFKQQEQKRTFDRSMIFNWKNTLVTFGLTGGALGALLYLRKQKMDEAERQRKVMAERQELVVIGNY